MVTETPNLQQAAVVVNPGEKAHITLRNDLPVASPGRNEVLVKLTCTGLW
jgi:propanol-preferring alcohol dehydrogenase